MSSGGSRPSDKAEGGGGGGNPDPEKKGEGPGLPPRNEY